MERRTTLVLVVVCAATLCASISCGGKNPTEPTRAPNTSVTAPGGDDSVTAQATSYMRWTIADRCTRDIYGYQWRLFDMVTKKRWPTSGVYRTSSGGTKSVTISCTTNHKICVGGTTYPATSYSFGVGINGTRRATSLFCKSCSPISYKLTYSCPGLDGLAPGGEDWTEEESNPQASGSLAEDSDSEEFELESES